RLFRGEIRYPHAQDRPLRRGGAQRLDVGAAQRPFPGEALVGALVPDAPIERAVRRALERLRQRERDAPHILPGRHGRALLLLGRFEAEADGVDAVALVGGGRVALAGEDVAEMGAAAGAADLGADHAEGAVLDQFDRLGVARVVEGRPAAVRVELGRRAEQLIAAGAALVDAD